MKNIEGTGTRNQILETPANRETSEKNEELDQNENGEIKKTDSDDKRSLKDKVRDFFKHKDDDTKEISHSETDKIESRNDTGENIKQKNETPVQELQWGKLTDKQKQEYDAKVKEMLDKRKNNESNDTSENTEHADEPNSERARGEGSLTNHQEEDFER